MRNLDSNELDVILGVFLSGESEKIIHFLTNYQNLIAMKLFTYIRLSLYGELCTSGNPNL